MERLPPPKPRRDETSRDIAVQCTDGQRVHCVKLPGQSLMARDFDRQFAELRVRAVVLHGYSALGMPVTEAKGQVRLGERGGAGFTIFAPQSLSMPSEGGGYSIRVLPSVTSSADDKL
ncbi:hypothetical protein NBRC116599_14230 [Aquicoccus sp. SU-CL01552]